MENDPIELLRKASQEYDKNKADYSIYGRMNLSGFIGERAGILFAEIDKQRVRAEAAEARVRELEDENLRLRSYQEQARLTGKLPPAA